MKVHVFKAQLMGWSEEMEDVMFDAERYSKDEAESYFVEKTGITDKNGYEVAYKYYECGGKEYYNYHYVGIEDRNVNDCETF